MDDHQNEYELCPPPYTIKSIANVNHIGDRGGDIYKIQVPNMFVVWCCST